ncbi:bifunctional riboflavin kinase/FAD synthetase [Clostridium swellfunianum]|uniref:bifunctional riboflavin kinase/FAD synthetase n=1 Tax=Clostridium swellfunianum TaxID=1367462 RepID=UPI002030FFE1|nr:bifunctional riboflavin kinase/FAD synthetase [Clostridium swellfunianum]MCM0648579.1 bifunctional riboflavin kinase/FAD synthetase [Clostridium swellfunianum]
MIILEDNFNEKLEERTYIALGSFDGLHLGHMGLINKTLELSKQNNIKSMVYTFKNHPLSIVNKEKVPKLLMDNDTKISILDKLGVDIVNLVNFNIEYMKILPEAFIEKMVEYYNLKGLIVGFNYRFGYKNSGNIDLLKEYSSKLDFELHVIESVTYENEVVSSSKIRSLLNDGNVYEANKMLIVPYALKGEIIKGKQLGRTLGFPTANLKYNSSFQIPATGVYYTAVEYEDKLYKGITSVGYNPTIEPVGDNITIETYILDFDKFIYGESITLYFIDRMRNEEKFASLEELKEQLIKDKEYANKQNLEIFLLNNKK